jgi:hypothetical protein
MFPELMRNTFLVVGLFTQEWIRARLVRLGRRQDQLARDTPTQTASERSGGACHPARPKLCTEQGWEMTWEA